MKLLIATTAAALFSTAAFAEMSTKQMDQNLDTSNSASQYTTTEQTDQGSLIQYSAKGQNDRNAVDSTSTDTGATMSTRSQIASPGEGYPYGGYGEGNDSR